MARDRGCQPITAAQVEAYIADLASDASLPVPQIRWLDGSSSGQALRRHGADVIMLGRGVLDNAEDARFTAAHEMGHIALGHTCGRRTGLTIALYVAPALAAMAAATTLAVIVLGRNAFGLGTIGALLWLLLLQPPLLRRLKQPAEYAADVYAATHGASLTAELAAHYARQRPPGSRLVSRLFPVHPSWSDRAAVVAPLGKIDDTPLG